MGLFVLPAIFPEHLHIPLEKKQLGGRASGTRRKAERRMKKIVLMMAVVLTLATGSAMAETQDWKSGIDVGGTVGLAPDSGNASVGISLGYNGVSVAGYAGGHRTDGRKSGYGGDLRVDLSEYLSLVTPYGYLLVDPPISCATGEKWFLGLYGEVGGYYQRSSSSCRVLTSGNSCSTIDGRGEFTGGGGLYLRIPSSWLDPSISGLRLGLGYHTAKGVNTSFGVYW